MTNFKLNLLLNNFQRLITNQIRLISTLLFVVPIIMGFFYVYLFGINVVYWDHWWMIPLFDAFYQNKLSINNLFAYNNEHPMFFPKSVMLFLGTATHFNNIVEMYIIQLLLLISLMTIMLAIKRQFTFTKLYYWFIPIPYIIFSFREHQNILWGFQIGFLMAYTFGILAFYLLSVISNYENKIATISLLICGIISAFISSFSSAMGLFVWPAGLVQIAISPIERSTKLWCGLSWASVGLFAWLLYISHYVKPPHHTFSIFDIFHKPIYIIQFYLTNLGSSLFWNHISALLSGILFFLLLVYLITIIYKMKRVSDNSFWISLIIFSLLTSMSITISRSFQLIYGAMASRYTIFSALVIISVYIMIIDIKIHKNNYVINRLYHIALMVILLSIVNSYYEGIKIGIKTSIEREKLAYILFNYESQNDELLKSVYPNANFVKEYAPILKKYKLNVFSR